MGSVFQPSTKRSDINTAPMPELTPGTEDLLRQFQNDPQSVLNRFLPTSSLQRQTGSTYEALLGGLTGQQTAVAGSALANIIQGGQGVLNAAQPLFQRNLEFALRANREFGGPSRFNAAVARQGGELSQRALGDFNLFSQQVLESGANRQLQALLGGLSGASAFALGQEQNRLPLIQQLLGQNFGASVGAPIITQGPSAFDVFGQLAALGANFVPGGGGGGFTPTAGGFQASPGSPSGVGVGGRTSFR